MDRSPERCSPVGPDRIGGVTERADPEVVARERHRAVVELLVVRVRRHVGDARLARPGVAAVGRLRREHVEGRHRRAIGAVADRPRDAVARVECGCPTRSRAAMPPSAEMSGNTWCPVAWLSMTARSRVAAGRAVVADEERRCLADLPGSIVWYVDPVGSLRVRLRRVVDDVHPLMRRVELVGRRANLRVAAEERVAGRAGVVEVAAVSSRARAGLAAWLIAGSTGRPAATAVAASAGEPTDPARRSR